MPQTAVTISCDNDQTARIQGAEKLGVQPDKVTVKSVDPETYKVTLLDVPGQLDIVVLDRAMNAVIREITPPVGDGRPVSVEDVEKKLADLNVVFGIDKEVIENTVAEVAATGIAQHNVRVAAGKPAKDGVDARIDFKFRLSGEDPEVVEASRRRGKLDPTAVTKEMVSEGQVVAVKIPLEEPVDGSTVTGEPLSGAEPKDKTLTAGTNVTLLEDQVTCIVAKGITAGYADYVNGSLMVEPSLRVSRDKLSVFLSVHPPAPSGNMLTTEMVGKMLTDLGVTYGIKPDVIQQALEEAAATQMPVLDTVIAEGEAPEPGENARITFQFQTEKTVGTVDQETGVIDYKERQALQNVKAGQVLAVKVPPTDGKNGISVYGDAIVAKPGMDRSILPGENVALSGDGLELTAAMDGVVILTQDDKVGVFKLFEVPGDVDYSTGNLSMEGTLNIKGWIRSGFQVKAKGDIQVGEGIENACVEAGENISVKGGIIGSEQGKIHAGGSITARFMENAQVHAGGDIRISNHIVRSTVTADGRVLDTRGKACIRGGSVSAGKGITMNELGSPAGIVTHVSVGAAPELRERIGDISQKLAEYRRSKIKINMALAKYDTQYQDKALRRDLLSKLETLRQQRRMLAAEEEKLVKERQALSKKIFVSGGKPPTVKVKTVVYSGTTVMVNGYVCKVSDDIKGKVIFVLDEEEQAVKMVR